MQTVFYVTVTPQQEAESATRVIVNPEKRRFNQHLSGKFKSPKNSFVKSRKCF